MVAEQGAEAGSVKYGSAAEDPVSGKPESLMATEVMTSIGLEAITRMAFGACSASVG